MLQKYTFETAESSMKLRNDTHIEFCLRTLEHIFLGQEHLITTSQLVSSSEQHSSN